MVISSDIEEQRDNPQEHHVSSSPDLGGGNVDGANESPKSDEGDTPATLPSPPAPLGSVGQVFSFGKTRRTLTCLVIGIFSACVSGCLYPAIAFYMAKVFEELAAPTSNEDFLENVRKMAFTFMVIGAVALVSMGIQNTLLEIAASEMTMSLKMQWFDALLRQDLAYFDINDVAGTAAAFSSGATKYRRGVGRKLGMGVQFTITFIGSLAYAFYASWRITLLIMAVLPVIAASVAVLMKVNQSQTARANSTYAEAGSIAYTTVSAIRTILSLNICVVMLEKFKAATEGACRAASSFAAVVGFTNGMVLASSILAFLVVTLYGSYLQYKDVRDDGCDPSGSVPENDTCDVSGMDVFGALFGVFIGASALPQVSIALEAFTGARAACYPALVVMNRKVGCDGDGSGDNENAEQSNNQQISATSRRGATVPLPKYTIDSSSLDGKKPSSTEGRIEFRDVSFAYPTRSEALVLNGLSLEVEEGKTIAIVGPSGCGKSTIAQLIERFYDPTAGSVHLDGINLRELNVKWLREQIGLVSQEPILFAKSIKDNIAYGSPGATQEEIEAAAVMANAHDFITSFPKSYDTNVGDMGMQLSGGQKQRIAIARVLVKRPKILVLDEATSALDSENERTVQSALDKLLVSSNRTTIIIAHRLSTIVNADMIAVLENGRIVERGNHSELMELEGSRYRKLVEAQSGRKNEETPPRDERVTEGGFCDSCNGGNGAPQLVMRNVHFSYPTRPENKIFRGLNLTVKQGETIALVGPSGCGKSTVVQLIERFYDPDSGAIELEGADLKELNVKWLRDQLGLVSQEPTLFDTSIAENVRYGCLEASQAEIEDACMKANAHDFISSFPDGYDTQVGERGAQVSGGQKQRIAIARAILKKPKILLLDEATSALDTESERLVQTTLDNIMAEKLQTTILIAHRLSTVRRADRIAVIEAGKVTEIGTHDELMLRPNGRYRRLQAFQNFDADVEPQEEAQALPSTREQEKELTVEREEARDSVDNPSLDKKNAQRARLLAKDDVGFFAIGGVGAVFAGLVFPAWGILTGYMIELLYKPVFPCDSDCDEYFDDAAREMQDLSLKITYGWLGTIGSTLIGYVLLYHGFGTASERMNKRVRDSAFKSLVRQEVAFFDKRSVGSITSQLQEDAALIHSFSGEPIRTLILNLASVLVGVIVSFVYMWAFAVLSLLTLPFLAFGAEVEMRVFYGEDEGEEIEEGKESPGGILVETLLNIRTVASLTIENLRSMEYTAALRAQEPTVIKTNLLKGMTTGLGFCIQCWGMAFMFWWGGWLLSKHPDLYSFRDFNVSMFALFFSLYGMAEALEGTTNREKAREAAKRMFLLIDRESEIDPLSDSGKKGF